MLRQYRNSNLLYYARNYLRKLIPDLIYQKRLENKWRSISRYDQAILRERLNHYNKLQPTALGSGAEPIGSMTIPKKGKVYHFDLVEFTRWFHPDLLHHHVFGDVIHVPDVPAIVKSRPIEGDNRNSVVMKLEKMRHFSFIDDPVPFEKKRNHLIGMAAVAQPHRIRFYEKYFNHPMCTLGQINRGTEHDHWIRPRMSIRDHLNYKFILCLEGHDVASNLKWVMSSGSLPVMPEPVYETWFMESKLLPDVHYVRIARDYHDLEERLQYYMDHPAEGLEMNHAARLFINQFLNPELEDLLSLLVLGKYFIQTGQMEADAVMKDLLSGN